MKSQRETPGAEGGADLAVESPALESLVRRMGMLFAALACTASLAVSSSADDGDAATQAAMSTALARDAKALLLDPAGGLRVVISKTHFVEHVEEPALASGPHALGSLSAPSLRFFPRGRSAARPNPLRISDLPPPFDSETRRVQWIVAPASDGTKVMAFAVLGRASTWREGQRLPMLRVRGSPRGKLGVAYSGGGACLGLAVLRRARGTSSALVYGRKSLSVALASLNPIRDPSASRRLDAAAIHSAIAGASPASASLAQPSITSLDLMKPSHPWAPDEVRRIVQCVEARDGAGEAYKALRSIEVLVSDPTTITLLAGGLLARSGQFRAGERLLTPLFESPQVGWEARTLLLVGSQGESAGVRKRVQARVFPLPADPCPEELRLPLGVLLRHLEHSREAARVLEPLALRRHAPPRVKWEYGRALLSLERWRGAEHMLRLAARAPKAPKVWRADLAIALMFLGQLDEAEQECSAVVRMHPSDFGVRLGRAEIRVKRGNRMGALADMDAAVAASPDEVLAWLVFARLAHDLGDSGRVERARGRLRTLSPEALGVLDAQLRAAK